MSELAYRAMTLEEFFRWDDGTDTHYELIGGFPVAMAPPAAAHRIIAMRLGPRIDAALASRRPCNAQGDAGIIRPDRADTYFEADIAATCERHEFGQQALKEPFLIVEILSPSTERHDRRVKLPVYRQIDTVQEILLIDSDGLYAELHRRAGTQWITEILRGSDAVLSLTSAGVDVRLGELYDGIELAEPNE
jgi:Uma2 family endonuclease